MNRIDRVTAILIQLQSKRIVKAQDIADRFQISLRTVYRDIRTLEEAGVPVIGETGVGYSLMDGYRLPPIMFTMEEATAFLTAEKLIEKLTDSSTEESYKSALYKIKAVLRSNEKDYLENMNGSIEVLANTCIPQKIKASHPLQHILKSISDKKVLSIHYFANYSQEATIRAIEPIGIFYMGSYWYLIAFCQLRHDYRYFRTDRITDFTITDLEYKKEHPSLKSYLKQMTKEKELFNVVILVNKDTLKHLGEQKYYNGFISQKELNGKIEMTFLTSSMEGFARWYMMFGDQAEIISPDHLKTMVKRISNSILKNLVSSGSLETSQHEAH